MAEPSATHSACGHTESCWSHWGSFPWPWVVLVLLGPLWYHGSDRRPCLWVPQAAVTQRTDLKNHFFLNDHKGIFILFYVLIFIKWSCCLISRCVGWPWTGRGAQLLSAAGSAAEAHQACCSRPPWGSVPCWFNLHRNPRFWGDAFRLYMH